MTVRLIDAEKSLDNGVQNSRSEEGVGWWRCCCCCIFFFHDISTSPPQSPHDLHQQIHFVNHDCFDCAAVWFRAAHSAQGRPAGSRLLPDGSEAVVLSRRSAVFVGRRQCRCSRDRPRRATARTPPRVQKDHSKKTTQRIGLRLHALIQFQIQFQFQSNSEFEFWKRGPPSSIHSSFQRPPVQVDPSRRPHQALRPCGWS